MAHGWTLFCARARRVFIAASLALCALSPAAAADAPKGPKADLHGKVVERWNAAYAAINHTAGAPSAADIAAMVEREPNVNLRYTLLQALSASDYATALPVLVRVLNSDPALMVRYVAARELIHFNDASAAHALAGALSKDAALEVRRACAQSLGLQSAPEAGKALVAAAAHTDAGIREAAGWALIQQPRSRDIDRVLDRLENDADKSVAKRVHDWRQWRRSKP